MNIKSNRFTLPIIIGVSMFAGSYLATNVGFTAQQQQNIVDLQKFHQMQAYFNGNAQRAKAADAQQAEPKAAPVQQAAPVANKTPERTKHTLKENYDAMTKQSYDYYHSVVMDYTTSDQEQLKFTCNSDEDGLVSWQAGIERYSVDGVEYVKSLIKDDWSMRDYYKAKGYKCDMTYTGQILKMESSAILLAELSDGFPHSVEEFKEASK